MTENNEIKRGSKFLSLVLRHDPAKAGVALDALGWAEIDALLAGAPQRLRLDRARLDKIVAENDKKRFEISECGGRIRAVQGHSVAVELEYRPLVPPQTLYHGTATRYIGSIERTGLRPGNRRHVHLSADVETARKVGARHGVPVILRIDAARAHAHGQRFYQAANGVWLTDPLSKAYLARLDA